MKRNKGMTLVALAVTVLVLIVLTGVVISILIGNENIIDNANSAVKKYNSKVNDEKNLLEQTETYLNKHITGWIQEGNTIKCGDMSLTVGQSIEYDETKNGEIKGLTNVEWKVIGAENGELLIMSTEDIGTKYLEGASGYFNGISVLNDMCAVYGFGKGANGARSINVNDINRITGYSPERTGNGEIYGKGKMYQYMNEVEINYDTFTMNGTNGVDSNISQFLFMLNSKTNKLEDFSGSEYPEKVVSNYYSYFPTTLSDIDSDAHIGLSEGSEVYKLLFGTNEKQAKYWLADSFVRALTGYFLWGLRGISEGEVHKISYFAISTGPGNLGGEAGVRAVVRISSSANIQPNKQSGIMEII